MSDLSVYAITPLGSVPLHALAPVGKVAFSTTFGAAGGCGLDQLSFSMTLPRGYSNPLLVQGTVLELRAGAAPLGRATLTTPDFDTGAVTATGLFKRGVDFIGFADLTTLAGTLNPKVALQNAIAQGLEWHVDAATLAALDVTLATTGTSANLDNTTWYYISDLLDSYCAQKGANVFWGIDPGGFLRIYTTPVVAAYILSPSVPAMDSTTTDYVTDLVCRYSDITKPVGDGSTFYASAVMASVPVRVGSTRKQATEDITDHGPLTKAQAQDIANQTLAAKSPTLTYNGGVDVTPGDVRTIDGGAPTPLWRVVAGAGSGTLLRHHGWRNMQGALMPGFAQSWVIGKASYADTGAVSLSPTADAAKTIGQTLSSTVAQVAEIGKQVQVNDPTVAVGALHATLALAQQDLAQAQADIDAKISYGTEAPTDATPGTPGSMFYVQAGDPPEVTEQYICTAGTGAASGNTWERQQLNAAQLVVPGTIEAEHLAVTQDVTGKSFFGGTFTGQTFIGAEFKTDTAGRRMELGHNQSGGDDPSNLTFYNGFTGETPGVIGPWGGEPGGNMPALAIAPPSQPSNPYAPQVNLRSGSTDMTYQKAANDPLWNTQKIVTITGNAQVNGDLYVNGRVRQGYDTLSGGVGYASGVTNYGGGYGPSGYTWHGDLVVGRGLLKITANQAAGAWLCSGWPKPLGGQVLAFSCMGNAGGGTRAYYITLSAVNNIWCITIGSGEVALTAGGWISLANVMYTAE
jgi:hypothetical protein